MTLQTGGQCVQLTNLKKAIWQSPLITKGQLLQYYADISPHLLPHLSNRAMEMQRYPEGVDGEVVLVKRAPQPRPDWLELCSIEHAGENTVDLPLVQDLFSLLWMVNLDCIGLNPCNATCDDIERPDLLSFDFNPVGGTDFARVCAAALLVRDELNTLSIPAFAKTNGDGGIHVYVPIMRGPRQDEVWSFAKQLAQSVAAAHPQLVTVVDEGGEGRVLIDYDQNACGHTLASVYSVRPHPRAPVSTPVTWKEVERGFRSDDFRIDNLPARLRAIGDLWAPLLAHRGRFQLFGAA